MEQRDEGWQRLCPGGQEFQALRLHWRVGNLLKLGSRIAARVGDLPRECENKPGNKKSTSPFWAGGFLEDRDSWFYFFGIPR